MFTRYLDIPGTLSKMAISGPMKHAVLAASGRQPAAGSSTPALQAPFQRWFFPENHRDIEGDIQMDCLYGYHYGPEPKKWICRCENGWLPIHSHNMTERFTIFDNLKRPHHSLMVNKVVKPKTILQFGMVCTTYFWIILHIEHIWKLLTILNHQSFGYPLFRQTCWWGSICSCWSQHAVLRKYASAGYRNILTNRIFIALIPTWWSLPDKRWMVKTVELAWVIASSVDDIYIYVHMRNLGMPCRWKPPIQTIA